MNAFVCIKHGDEPVYLNMDHVIGVSIDHYDLFRKDGYIVEFPNFNIADLPTGVTYEYATAAFITLDQVTNGYNHEGDPTSELVQVTKRYTGEAAESIAEWFTERKDN